ncbi:hypothetical protein, partial [Kroppenstedtia sanguinis]|uniref:hypothetical protein n=1 Tax=Kroppenstedtia sanguinis TaxID=1380684 RepID=UPI0036D36A10
PAENLEGGRLGATSSLCCFRKALPLPDGQIWSGQFSLPCRMATVAWVNTISPPKIWLINTPVIIFFTLIPSPIRWFITTYITTPSTLKSFCKVIPFICKAIPLIIQPSSKPLNH